MNNQPPPNFDPNAPIYDKIGQQIKSGDIVVYGHLIGRCAALKIGKVVKAFRKWSWQGEEFRISVVGVEDYSYKKVKELSRMGTLQFPDRIIVLETSKVPQEYKDLLDKVIV